MSIKKKNSNTLAQTLLLPFILFIYRITVGFYITRIMFNVKVKGINLSKIKEPYILIGNHVTNYDGLIYQQHTNRNISFIINERIFRIKYLGKIMQWFHMIPKKKFSNDLRAVRLLFAAKQRGSVIGIFPEGRRNWDGCTARIIPSIATLVKSLKIPVVIGTLKGAFTSDPRWGDKIRKGKVIAEYKMILTKQDIKNSTSDQILEKINQSMDFKEHKFLKENRIDFKSNNPANGLERLLYLCPKCNGLCTLTSYDHEIKCNCGYTATYDNYGKLTCEHFDNLYEWNNWQKEQLKDIKYTDSNYVVFHDKNVTLLSVPIKSFDKHKKIDFGEAQLFRDRLVFNGEKQYIFDLKEIWGCNIQKNNCFEFNNNNICYLLSFSNKDNAYKWMTYMEI
jgi:1-acyl-sn-glycerol-3-phosphate acyltransferase